MDKTTSEVLADMAEAIDDLGKTKRGALPRVAISRFLGLPGDSGLK